MEIEREDLLRAVGVLNLVPIRPGMTASEFIKIDKAKGKVRFSLCSELRGEVLIGNSKDWPVALPYFIDRRMFVPFVEAGKEQGKKSKFIFGADKNENLTVRHGTRRGTFAAVAEISGYGEIKIAKDADVIAFGAAQKSMIACAKKCATPDTAVPHLNCVFIRKQGVVMSTNTLVIFTAETDKFKQSIPLPLYVLDLLTHEGLKTLRISSKSAVLDFGFGRIMQSMPVKAVKGFPVKDIVTHKGEGKKYPLGVRVSSARLAKCLERFARYMQAVRRKERMVTLVASKGGKRLTIRADAPNVIMEESIMLATQAKRALECSWALDLIVPVLDYLALEKKKVEVRFDDEQLSPYVLSVGDIQLILARKVK